MDITQETLPATPEVPFLFEDRSLSHGIPARSFLGLPIARLVPQDIHSLADYAAALSDVVVSFLAESTAAQICCAALGGSGLGVALTTDYKLSAVKLIPISAHEAIDYAWGLANIVAPFLFGYRKKDPVVSAIQIAVGASVILTSMFTDYRGYTREPIGFAPLSH